MKLIICITILSYLNINLILANADKVNNYQLLDTNTLPIPFISGNYSAGPNAEFYFSWYEIPEFEYYDLRIKYNTTGMNHEEVILFEDNKYEKNVIVFKSIEIPLNIVLYFELTAYGNGKKSKLSLYEFDTKKCTIDREEHLLPKKPTVTIPKSNDTLNNKNIIFEWKIESFQNYNIKIAKEYNNGIYSNFIFEQNDIKSDKVIVPNLSDKRNYYFLIECRNVWGYSDVTTINFFIDNDVLGINDEITVPKLKLLKNHILINSNKKFKKINIFNLNGKKIYTKNLNINTSEHIIPVTLNKNQLYLISLFELNGNISNFNLVK